MTPSSIRRLADRIECEGDDIAAMAWVSGTGDPDLIERVRQSEEGAASDASPKTIYPGILRRIAEELED